MTTKLRTINKLALRILRLAESISSKPLRKVVLWQIYAALALALLMSGWGGMHGAVSALLGASINMIAGLVYAIMVTRCRAKSAGETLRTLIRAESSKIALIVLQLWLVLTAYREVVPVAFFGAFVVTVLVFPLALLVRD
jgi:ATP synthase protein I